MGTRIVPIDRPCPHSYLMSVNIFYLSRAVSELFSLYTFGDLWPRVSRSTLTPVSNATVPFGRSYPTSYLRSFDISCLTRTVYELFHWPTFGELWPRLSRIPLTPGETWIAPIDRSCPHSYLMSVDIFYLSRAVSELFSLYAFGDLWPRVSRSSVTPGSTAMVPFERS